MINRFLSNTCLPWLIVLILGVAPIATKADLVTVSAESEGSVFVPEDLVTLMSLGTSAFRAWVFLT